MKLIARVHLVFLLLAFVPAINAHSQSSSEEDRFLHRLKLEDSPPADLLSSRSVVLFSAECTQADLEEIQKGFQQIGIDAISYVESERALAGHDLMNSYARYFVKRNIRILIFLKKEKGEYNLYITPFSGTAKWTSPEPSAWFIHSLRIGGSLQTIYRAVASTQKRQNFLVNDYPERSGPLGAISGAGKRDETLAPNLRALKLAVPRTGDTAADADLEKYFKENFPAKYEIVESNVDEKELIQKGFIYVLRFIHAPGTMAKQILGYDMDKAESAFITVSYVAGNLQLKTLNAETTIYKFYIKHLEDDISYLGLKWDADITWQDALKNHIEGYRATGKLN